MFLLSYFQRTAYLAFVYFATAAWDGIYEILSHVVFCWGFDSEEMFTNVVRISYGQQILKFF